MKGISIAFQNLIQMKSPYSFILSSTDMSSVSQTDSQAYGPVKSSEDEKYRVTSLLSVDTKNLHAVTDGEILVFNTSNSSLVNIFLKADIDYSVSVAIPRVKYFVYRGVKKDSFFATNGDVKGTDDNSVLKSLNSGEETSGSLSPAARKGEFKDSFTSVSQLGTTDLIDPLFLDKDYCQFKVLAGWSLGVASSSFGFEIMLNENGFNPTIAQARTLENVIDISSLTGVNAKIEALNVLNYIDPAAFFGLFFRSGERLRNPLDNKGVAASRDCYTFFVSKFYTKNTVYLDLRNKYELPPTINVTGKDFNQIKVSKDGSSPSSTVDYNYFAVGGSSIDNWPIHIQSGGFTSPVTQSNYDYFRLRVEMPRKNDKELIYLSTSHLSDSWPDAVKYEREQNFKKLTNKDANWKDDFELRMYRGDSNATNNVASYIRVSIHDYSNEDVIKDQIVNVGLDELTAESIKNQLSPTLINMGHSNNLTRGNEPNATENKHKTYSFGSGNSFYSEVRGVGCELTRGKAVDTIGEVCFAYRTADKIVASGITNNPDRSTDDGGWNNIWLKEIDEKKYFYEYVKGAFINENELLIHADIKVEEPQNRKYRSYRDLVVGHSVDIKSDVLQVHKVRFSDSGNAKTVLELRVKDPFLIRGLQGNSPSEPFTSIAYTYTQRQTIDSAVGNFLNERFCYFETDTSSEITNASERKVFKRQYKLIGIKDAGSGNLKLDFETLNLTFYSIDGSNYFTTEYAVAHESLFDDGYQSRIIENKLIPDFIENGPFTSTIQDAMETRLQQIAGTSNERIELMYGDVRDYMFNGNLNKLTFEMAFRLPFYIKDPSKIPYSDMGGIKSKAGMSSSYTTKKVNNPYFEHFHDWFTKANEIRALDSELLALKKTGLTYDFDNTTEAAYEVISFPEDFFSFKVDGQERGKPFDDHNVPAHLGRAMADENYVMSKWRGYESKPHLPGSPKWTLVEIAKSKLDDLKNGGIISSNVKTKLSNLVEADFGFTAAVSVPSANVTIDGKSYTPGQFTHTKFIFKKPNSTTYYFGVSCKGVAGASGITTGFGYDMGQQEYSKFATYTPQNSSINPDWATTLQGNIKEVTETATKTIQKLEIVKRAHSGSSTPDYQGNGSVSLYKGFEDQIWSQLDFPYSTAIKEFVPFMNEEYVEALMNELYRKTSRGGVTDPVFSLYPSSYYKDITSDYYFEANGIDVLNEAEKFIGLTFCYNGGSSNVKLNSGATKYKRLARYLNHAFNTHDVRWLRITMTPALEFTKSNLTGWMNLNQPRRNTVTKFLYKKALIDHYKIQ